MLSYPNNPHPYTCPCVGMQSSVWSIKRRKGGAQRWERELRLRSSPCASLHPVWALGSSLGKATTCTFSHWCWYQTEVAGNISEGFRPSGLGSATGCSLELCNPDNAELNQKCVGRNCFWVNLNQFLDNWKNKWIIRIKFWTIYLQPDSLNFYPHRPSHAEPGFV